MHSPLPQIARLASDGRSLARGQQGPWLYLTTIGAVALACLFYGVTAHVRDPLHLYEGLLIFVLACLPSIQWANRTERGFPLFEVLLLTTANTYAMPLLSGQEQLNMYPIETITLSGWAVILYQLAAIVTHSFVVGHPGRASFFTREVISHDLNRYIGYGLILTTMYTFVVTFFDVISEDLVGVLRAGFYGIGIVAAFVQSRRWGLGDLTHREKIAFVINLALQVVIQFSTLFLVGGISLLVLAMVGYVSGSRRLPILAMLIAIAAVAILHNGKGTMRTRYWNADGARQQVTPLQLPEFYADWIGVSLDAEQSATGKDRITASLLERTSLFHMLCLVAAQSPDRLPFLNGLTYEDIPGQLVPRFFWPEKPIGHVSTSRLCVYYGLQREEDTMKTTIGFGLLAEAYANFGLFGTGFLGLFLGAFYKKIETLCQRSPLLSYAGLLQIVLMAWSFQTEYPMSMWLSSMLQAIMAVLGVPFILRNFLG